ncbi:MAG: serine/threonine-protein kinase [Giesbergeria sp.]|jgi:serine/threonine protein kinase|nr:serine/threonine-protein kinase [Giesbergeria sp.]
MIESPSSAPAKSALHVDALPVGFRLGEFEVLALLGVGGFGMVYKAFDHSLHRAVAIKEFMPAALAARTDDGSLLARSPADQAAFMAGLRSFVAEARLLAQFDHPSLVKVFRFWEANNTAYMVMPLYSGMTFKQARAQMRTPPPEAWLRKVLWSVLGALRVLHGGQTLHRDVSPDNIFLQDAGPPVLLDLGAARHAINDRDRKLTAVLKVNYAPIEQYADGDAELTQGPWSDLYSLAAVVHGCLCNDTPLPSTLRAIRDRMVPFARVARTVKRQFGQEYSPAFVAAISQALALRPEDRPQSIDAFLQIMEMTTGPEGVEHFDFRAELGDLWVEPTDQPGPGAVVPTVDVSSAQVGRPTGAPAPVAAVPAALTALNQVEPAVQAVTAAAAPQPQEPAPEPFEAGDTVFLDAGDTVVMEDVPDSSLVDPAADGMLESQRIGHSRSPSQKAASRSSGSADRAGRKGQGKKLALPWLAMGAAVFVVAAVAGVYGWRSPAPQPADTIITEMAEPASVAAPAMVQASDTDSAAPLASAADAGASAPPGIAPAASVPAPAFVVASDPRAASRVRRPAPVAPAAAVQAPEPAPVRPPQTESPPPVAPPPPRPAPPVRLCEDTNVLTHSMCLRDECRKPAFAALPACVEYRRRMEPLERQQLAN